MYKDFEQFVHLHAKCKLLILFYVQFNNEAFKFSI